MVASQMPTRCLLMSRDVHMAARRFRPDLPSGRATVERLSQRGGEILAVVRKYPRRAARIATFTDAAARTRDKEGADLGEAFPGVITWGSASFLPTARVI